jgi:DNA polymerase elongation subunit (family B)
MPQSMIDFPSLDFTPPPDTDERGPSDKRAASLPIYTLDLETDPFKMGRYPIPFCAGLYTGDVFHSTWGPDCVDRIFEVIANLPPGIIYIHNGGKFDLFYMMKFVLGHPALIINGRIVRTYTKSRHATKPHEIRDSYAIMPFALDKYQKTKIDYNLFEKEVREQNRDEILSYLRDDCVYLYELCSEFYKRFGNKLTIGATSMGELRKLHTFEKLGPITDKEIRDHYYYGGRVQCFQRGILKGRWKVYDVNSMYPFAMRNFLHPVDTPEAETRTIRKSTCFISAWGKNYGAFPTRTKNGLRFDIESGLFHVSIHEWHAAQSSGLFVPLKIQKCINFRHRNSFAEFVDTFYELRNKAKDTNDSFGTLFYKYVLNSAYGKFAQNSAKYMEYAITDGTVNLEGQNWQPYSIDSLSNRAAETYIIWKRRPVNEVARMYNVATGASITGAARAILMEAIAKADTPIYCDTDSIICKHLDVSKSDGELGAWKLEAKADVACIAMKKLYALFLKGECVKQANKGVRITPAEIRKVAQGEEITYNRAAPSYHLDGTHSFITRRISMKG